MTGVFYNHDLSRRLVPWTCDGRKGWAQTLSWPLQTAVKMAGRSKDTTVLTARHPPGAGIDPALT